MTAIINHPNQEESIYQQLMPSVETNDPIAVSKLAEYIESAVKSGLFKRQFDVKYII
jgi:hypothetical protein